MPRQRVQHDHRQSSEQGRTVMTEQQFAGSVAATEGSKPPQVHEGFSEALGLPLKTADGDLLFKPTHTRYYQTLGAEHPNN